MNYLVSVDNVNSEVFDTVEISENDNLSDILFEIDDLEISDNDEISSFFRNDNSEVFDTVESSDSKMSGILIEINDDNTEVSETGKL